MTKLECDVAVIGAGTAGLAAERSARRAGARTLLIDEKLAGTTCASVGCMPSKLLIAAARAAHNAHHAKQFGIDIPAIHIDGKAVLRRVRALRDEFVQSTLKSIDDLPEGVVVKAKASFINDTTLRLSNGDQVVARSVVIATGATPVIPSALKDLADLILTNETIFDLEDFPSSVAVIGGGPLGLELGQALARLGVRTAVFDQGGELASLKDDELSHCLQEILSRELPVHLGVEVKAGKRGDKATLSWSGVSSGEDEFDRVLVAAGRPPQLSALDLDKTSLELDRHGTPVFDRRSLQCGNSSIFIAGDANADAPLLHEASSEGAIAGRNAAIYPELQRSARHVPLSITFTDPPVAVIGRPPREHDTIGTVNLREQGRAKVDAKNHGLIRIYADGADARIAGAAMAAPDADHLAHLLAWAIGRGETAQSLLRHPFYHPTVEEALKTALAQICDATRTDIDPDRDKGAPPGA